MTDETKTLLEQTNLTEMSLDRIISSAMMQAKAKSQDTVPIDTGNMRYYSYKNEHLGLCKYRVYFDMKGKHTEGKLDGIAPYAKYTNERPVRTQGWFDNKTVPTFVNEFAIALEREIGLLTGREFAVEIKEKTKKQ